jgi:DNA-binding CsgD family transcriptional regulator
MPRDRDIGTPSARPARRGDLTEREVEILARVARGRSNSEIASGLGVTEGTVKGHLRRIFLKLGVSNRTQAAIVALQRGRLRV